MKNLPWIIEWSDALSMSNAQIDTEHHQFIELVNELNHAILNQREASEIQQIMMLILEGAGKHFSNEERILFEMAYPAAKDHALLHRELIIELEQISKQFQDLEFSRYWIEAALKIKRLMLNHLMDEDTKYIAYLQSD